MHWTIGNCKDATVVTHLFHSLNKPFTFCFHFGGIDFEQRKIEVEELVEKIPDGDFPMDCQLNGGKLLDEGKLTLELNKQPMNKYLLA